MSNPGPVAKIARSNVSFTTGVLATGASETDDIAVFKLCKAIKLVGTRAARVRAYSTAAYRAADAARPSTVDPTGDHGCLMEVITTPTVLGLDLAPAASLHNMDSPPIVTIYFAVTNLDAAGANTITLTVLQEE